MKRYLWVIVFGYFILLWVGACKSRDSDPLISNGIPTSDYKRVVFIGLDDGWGCTGTIISDNTVLTAAHCLEVGTQKRKLVDIYLNDRGNTILSSKKFLYNADIKEAIYGGHGENIIYDIGVVVFDGVPFKGFSSLKIKDYHFKASDRILMVGYGCYTKKDTDKQGKKIVNCDDSRRIHKRYGKNHIYDPVKDKTTGSCYPEMIQVNQQVAFTDDESNSPTGEDTMMWKVDSGGPLFLDSLFESDKIIGIASYADGDYTNGRIGCYTKISYPKNIELLKKAVTELQAHIEFE